MDFIFENWGTIFSGIGTAVVVALVTWILNKRKKTGAGQNEQSASAGAGSQIVQAGRDAHVENFNSKKSGRN